MIKEFRILINFRFGVWDSLTPFSTIPFKQETPVFPLGIAALRKRNPGEKMVAGSIPLKGHF